MESDRWTFLTLRAYSSGRLDYSNRLDDRWRLKEAIVLAEVERELHHEMHRLSYEGEIAAAQYVEQEIFDYHYEKSLEKFDTLEALLLPYADLKPRKLSREERVRQATELWESEFGKLDDPKVQEALRQMEESAAELRKQRERNAGVR